MRSTTSSSIFSTSANTSMRTTSTRMGCPINHGLLLLNNTEMQDCMRMYCKSVSTGVVDGITRISQCAFGKPKSKEDLVGVATLGDMILYNDKVINEGGSVHYTHALAELCQCDAVVEFCKSNSCPIELVQLSLGFFTCTFALMRKPMILLNSVGFTSCSLPDFTKAVVPGKIQAALENKAAQKQTESSLTDAILSVTTAWEFFFWMAKLRKSISAIPPQPSFSISCARLHALPVQASNTSIRQHSLLAMSEKRRSSTRMSSSLQPTTCLRSGRSKSRCDLLVRWKGGTRQPIPIRTSFQKSMALMVNSRS